MLISKALYEAQMGPMMAHMARMAAAAGHFDSKKASALGWLEVRGWLCAFYYLGATQHTCMRTCERAMHARTHALTPPPPFLQSPAPFFTPCPHPTPCSAAHGRAGRAPQSCPVA